MLMPTNLALDRLFLEMLKTGAAIALKEIYKKDEKGHDNVFRYSATAVEFCRHLARCLITMQEYDVDEILASIVNVPEVFSDGNFLECLIFAADADPSATNRFWHIWEKLMSTISSMVHNAPKGVLVDKDGLIRAYLLAMPYWASDVKQWKHLSVGNMEFLDKVVDELKDVPGTAEALIRFANTVGQGFKQEIIPWLALVFEFAHFDAYDDDERIERIKKDMSPLLIEIAKNGDFVKADECWRKAFLNLLDHLVLHRSIEAFYVRDQILS
jgi:hypothetical protein